MAYNDNHTLFETNNILQKETRFGSTVIESGDDLFAADGPDDAYIIYSGK